MTEVLQVNDFLYLLISHLVWLFNKFIQNKVAQLTFLVLLILSFCKKTKVGFVNKDIKVTLLKETLENG